jgi:Asp-tRNA(Asn)/Glu-tRNA(Gln) amidotransferase A subunit family amidase
LQALDEDGLRGARIGILREPIGNNSDPESDDFKKVDSAFQQSVAELRAAGAILVDPLEIPDLKELLAKRASDEIASDEALRRYLARNPNSPYRTREDIANAPALLEGYPRPRLDRWEIPLPVTEPAEYLEYLRARDQLMINILKMMADHRLDAIVHKTVEHQPNLIEDGINPPYLSARGVPALNTFLAYSAIITAPSGFTSDGLPVGITFFGRPYSEPLLLKLSYAYEQATHHRRPPATTPGLVDANLATNPSR